VLAMEVACVCIGATNIHIITVGVKGYRCSHWRL
jgi:hypothetical protein